MKKHSGRPHAAARLNDSSVAPMLTAPSPKYVTATLSVPACRCAHAEPAANGTPPPTIAFVPMAPASRHRRCIEPPRPWRSEEHTSELQSRGHIVCRLLLEKK